VLKSLPWKFATASRSGGKAHPLGMVTFVNV